MGVDLPDPSQGPRGVEDSINVIWMQPSEYKRARVSANLGTQAPARSSAPRRRPRGRLRCG
eukprot:8653589-Lingulodinium_polyedra.AAC.1